MMPSTPLSSGATPSSSPSNPDSISCSSISGRFFRDSMYSGSLTADSGRYTLTIRIGSPGRPS
ncbi:hypothetical protein [Pseudomonas phage BL2]|nr:hypothetical protein [Pseudomonas phage BL2]